MVVDIMSLLKKPTFLIKVVELVMAIICTGLVVGQVWVSNDLNKIATIYVTIIGFIVISLIVLLGYIMEKPLTKYVILFIAGIGFIMFLTAGALMCETYDKASGVYQDPRLLASGILAIFNSFTYVGDAFLTFTETEA